MVVVVVMIGVVVFAFSVVSTVVALKLLAMELLTSVTFGEVPQNLGMLQVCFMKKKNIDVRSQ